jgi:cytochrome P450
MTPDRDSFQEKGVLALGPHLNYIHDRKYYPDPKRIDPEGFNEKKVVMIRHYVHQPFGSCPRI